MDLDAYYNLLHCPNRLSEHYWPSMAMRPQCCNSPDGRNTGKTPPMRLVRNLSHLDRDTSYRWQDADPIVEFLRNDITDSGWSATYLAERADVSVTTVTNIQKGKTKHPFNSTVENLLRALGWGRPIRR